MDRGIRRGQDNSPSLSCVARADELHTSRGSDLSYSFTNTEEHAQNILPDARYPLLAGHLREFAALPFCLPVCHMSCVSWHWRPLFL